MDREREDKLTQGISLTRGKREDEARRKARESIETSNMVEMINKWTKERGGIVTELTIIAGILTKYEKERRKELIRIIYQATITEIDEIMKDAERVREMGELKRESENTNTK